MIKKIDSLIKSENMCIFTYFIQMFSYLLIKTKFIIYERQNSIKYIYKN